MDNFARGKSFELKVAKMTRIKIDKSAKRNPGSHSNWNRRSDIFTDLPYHIECKDHETMKPKEWYRQADEASMNRTPVVAFQMDAEVMCMMRYDDFLNLLVEIADQEAELQDLRRPVQPSDIPLTPENKDRKITDFAEVRGLPVDLTFKRDRKVCKNGHMCTPGKDTCMTKGCQYSNTYKAPKAKGK